MQLETAQAPTSTSAVDPAASQTIWLLGLPVDVHTTESAVAAVIESIRLGRRMVFATPNLSFLRSAAENEAFARIVRGCDMSLADGTPLVWLARLLGARLPERVTGSGLFESLNALETRPPIRACFFGGNPGVAEAACERLIELKGGVTGVGAIDPGFGSLEEMSRDEIIAAINETNADLLVVSLGAEKGHMWLERNRERLDPIVASHLGAVVNFTAGTIRRAPMPWQRTGLEWLWRTLQEPRLASRYLADGLFLLKLLFLHVGPIAFKAAASRGRGRAVGIEMTEWRGGIALAGELTSSTCTEFRRWLTEESANSGQASGSIDLARLEQIDASGIGALHAFLRSRPGWSAVHPRKHLLRQLALHRALSLLDRGHG